MKVLAFEVSPYDFSDDSGRKVKGCNVTVVTEYANPSEEKASGHPSMKMSCTDDVAEKLRGKLPAILELATVLKKGAGGKATQTITGFNLVAPFDVLRLLQPKTPA